MISLDDYQNLLKTKDKLRRLKDQAQGAHDQILLRMKTESKCETKEELKKEIESVKKKLELKLPESEKAEKEFWDTWKESLAKEGVSQ